MREVTRDRLQPAHLQFGPTCSTAGLVRREVYNHAMTGESEAVAQRGSDPTSVHETGDSADSSIESATPCLVSYAHADEDDLGGVVSRLVHDLSAFYSATTGKSLEMFMDRTSIGWGEDWRDRIREAVANATVLLPVITMRYFQRESCCEELMAFYSNARQLGVTELLLPVVVLGADRISADDAREEVRLIEGLQYENIERSWLAGYDSGEWRSTIGKLAARLDSALAMAEQALVNRPTGATGPAESSAPDSVEPDLGSLQERSEALGPIVEQTLAVLTKFFGIVSEDLIETNWHALSSAQRNARLLATATRLQPLAFKIEQSGDMLLTRVSELDGELRAAVTELRAIGSSPSQALIDALLRGTEKLHELNAVSAQIDEVVDVLKAMSLLNVQLRRSIRPVIGGLQGVNTSVATIASWETLRAS